jgi:hypothetical protein
MAQKGCVGTIKHFCGNDQETNRHGVATFMTEQTLREVCLKGFEGALQRDRSLATMTAFNRIGCVPSAADYEIQTQVLRNEWGFMGINMTDSSKDSASYMGTADSLHAGTNQFNNDPGRVAEATSLLTKNRDGHIWSKLRETAKYYLYTMSRSNLVNGLAKEVPVEDYTPWWKPALIGLNAGVAVLYVASVALFLITTYGKKKEEKEVEESAVAKISDTLKQSPEEALIAYTEQVCSSMEKVTMIYDRTIVAVFKENRKVLRDMVSEAEEFYHYTRQQKYEIIPLLRTLEESDVNTGHFYVQVVDYISETSKALLHITRPCYKHVDNNHSGLTKEQVYDLKCINDRVEEIFGKINNMLRTRSFESMDDVLTKRDELFNFIDEVMQNQLRRLRDTGGSSSANMLFFNILTETKTMVLHSRNIMKSLEHFVDREE